MKTKARMLLMILMCASFTATAASVGTGGVSTVFSKGSTTLGVIAGSGSAFNDSYLILGVGAGYYPVRGLEVGVDVQHWFSGDPSISKISPKITYVFTQPKAVKPYLGAFFRRTFYGDFRGISIDDENSYGYRAGVYFSTDNRVFIGGGIVYEEFIDCNVVFADCSTTHPEIIITVGF